MDAAAFKTLESAIHRTLHAHSFSRSSSQASFVLTDLLSRYLVLLTGASAKYANHAGRTHLTVRDIIPALNELGISLEELSEYCSTEGKELGRYAVYTARRVEELQEFKTQLHDGLRQDRDDAIPLEYLRVPTPPLGLSDEEGDGEEPESEDEEVESVNGAPMEGIETKEPQPKLSSPRRENPHPRPSSPPLPLSPISNPSSPSRKRQRTLEWQPPSHVPDFLPPFPTTRESPTSPIMTHSPQPILQELPPAQIEGMKIEKPPITLSQPLTSTSVDYLTQVPYSQSSLASVPDWHLPTPPPPLPPARVSQYSIPQTEPSLLSAYHYILTHPPPPNPSPATLSRHKVAMTLLTQMQRSSRFDPPDTMYSGATPGLPRVASIGPTYAMAVDSSAPDPKSKGDGKEKEIKFPPIPPRPVSTLDRISPSLSQQGSRIPELARHVLPPPILARASRLVHPPVLYRGTKPLVYGSGIPAPWNSNPLPAENIPPTPVIKGKEPAGLLPNGKDKDKDAQAKPLIPDAKLFATWDFEPKDYRIPLPPSVRNRSRMGSVLNSAGGSTSGAANGASASGSGGLSLSLSSRTKSVSKIS